MVGNMICLLLYESWMGREYILWLNGLAVDAQHGSGEAEVINRLPLSLTPSRPRLARVGDDFEAGTVITVSGDQVEGVPVTVTLLADPDKAQNLKQLPSDDGNEPRVQGSQGCEDGATTDV